MSILKTKILTIQQHKQEIFCNKSSSSHNYKKTLEEQVSGTDKYAHSPLMSRLQSLESTSLSSPMSQVSQKNKLFDCNNFHAPTNVIKNYCRGIIAFALSEIVLKYLMPLLQKRHIELETFKAFIQANKSKINCIKQLRGMLLVTQDDGKEVTALKKIFKEITIIFLKYFSPNWIYNSKITDKYAHLKYRFKILRRVKNPIYFTYLQGFDYNSPLSKPCF